MMGQGIVEATRDVVEEHFAARRRLADEKCLAMQQLFNELRCLALSDADRFLAAVKATMSDTGFPAFDELLSHFNPSVGGGYGTKETRQRLADTWYAALEKANRKMWEKHMSSVPPLALVDTIVTLMPNELPPLHFVSTVTRRFNDDSKTTTTTEEKVATVTKNKEKTEVTPAVKTVEDKADMTWDQVTWPVGISCNCEGCEEDLTVEADRYKAEVELDHLIEALESVRQDEVQAKEQFQKAKKEWKQASKQFRNCYDYRPALSRRVVDAARGRRNEAYNTITKASRSVTRAKEAKKEAKKQISKARRRLEERRLEEPVNKRSDAYIALKKQLEADKKVAKERLASLYDAIDIAFAKEAEMTKALRSAKDKEGNYSLRVSDLSSLRASLKKAKEETKRLTDEASRIYAAAKKDKKRGEKQLENLE